MKQYRNSVYVNRYAILRLVKALFNFWLLFGVASFFPSLVVMCICRCNDRVEPVVDAVAGCSLLCSVTGMLTVYMLYNMIQEHEE